MQTKQISLTMPQRLYNDALISVEEGRYRGVQEFLVDLLRQRVAEQRRLHRIEAEMRKGKRIRMTREEALAYLRGP